MGYGDTLSAVRFRARVTNVIIQSSYSHQVHMKFMTDVTQKFFLDLDNTMFRMMAENLRLKLDPKYTQNLIAGDYTVADFERVRDWLLGKEVVVRWAHQEYTPPGFNEKTVWTWRGTLYEVVV